MAERVRTQREIPKNLLAVLAVQNERRLGQRNFRVFYAIPGGEDTDLTQPTEVRVGVEHIQRSSNIGGHMGRLILPGEFAEGFTASEILEAAENIKEGES